MSEVFEKKDSANCQFHSAAVFVHKWPIYCDKYLCAHIFSQIAQLFSKDIQTYKEAYLSDMEG